MARPGKVRILVADRHAVVRRGLRGLFEGRAGWKISAEAASGRNAVREAARVRPDVAIIELTMAELDGIDAARWIRAVSPRTKVLLFTIHGSDDVLREAREAGISGYVLKSDSEAELLDAVTALLSGEFYLSHRLRRATAKGVRGKRQRLVRATDAPKGLTRREREVVRLVAEGRSTKEVARSLGIGVRTADTHRTNLMRKLGLHSIADIVRYAVRNRIIDF